jgi:hypothetical protein
MNKYNNDRKGLSITFWEKKTGRFAMSHKEGLTADQVEELQKLKEGDQLIIYVNDKKTELSPTHTLKKFIVRDNDGGL